MVVFRAIPYEHYAVSFASLPETTIVKVDSMLDLVEALWDSQSDVSVEQDSSVPLSADDITNGSRLVVTKKHDSSGNDELTISKRWTDAKAKFLKESSDAPRMHQRIAGGGNDSFAVQLNIATDPIRRTELVEDPAFRRADEMIPRLSFVISSLWTDVAVIGNTPEGFPVIIINMYSTEYDTGISMLVIFFKSCAFCLFRKEYEYEGLLVKS